MTETEISQSLAMITVAWPDKPLFTDEEQMEEVVSLWLTMFADVPEGNLLEATASLVATATFRPSIAQLRKEAMRGRLGALTAGEAWSEVIKAIGRWGAGRTPEFSSPSVQLAVESIGGWTSICKSNNPTADRARFLDNFEAITSKAKHEVLAGRGDSVDKLLQERLPAPRARERNRLGGGVSIAGLLPDVGGDERK